MEQTAGQRLRQNPTWYISINVSAQDLKSERFLKVLTTQLASAYISPSQIRIEATERSFMDAKATIEILRAFRTNGFQVYIDDFGTGYSSLSYLQSFQLLKNRQIVC